jgi:hypothetical protein
MTDVANNTLSVSPLSMLVYAKGLLGEGGGPCVTEKLDSLFRRPHPSDWTKVLGGNDGQGLMTGLQRHQLCESFSCDQELPWG